MKKRLFIFILGILVLSSFVSAIPPIPEIPSFPIINSPGNTYHVDGDTGSDVAGDGSSSSPWETIQYGVNKLIAGDTLTIHETSSAYSEIVTISVSGTSWDNAITIKGADGERPEISGAGLGTARLVDIANGCSYLYIKNLYITYNTYSGLAIRENVSYIAVDDVEVAHGTVDSQKVAFSIGLWGADEASEETDHIYFRDCLAHDNGGFAFNWYHRTHDLLFLDCVVYNNGNEGFNGNGKVYPTGTGPTTEARKSYNVYIIGCTSYNNLESDGIDTGDTRSMVVIKDCIIYNATAEGIKVWGDEAWLINNIVYENYQSGINLKPFHVNSKYYMLHNTLVNNYQKDNWKHELRIFIPNAALEEATCSIYLYNNIFAMTGSTGARLIGLEHAGLAVVESENNYFFRNAAGNQFYQKCDDGPSPCVNQAAYNMDDINDSGTGDWQIDTGFDLNSISRTVVGDSLSDPGFVNLANDDYTLIESSLAVNAGIDVGITTDINGNLRDSNPDIGAFEYTGTTPSCVEGQITQACLCGGIEYLSGYCCSGSYQTTQCTVSPLPVFPGAEGFGTETRASYGNSQNPDIYVVNSTADTGGAPGNSIRNGIPVYEGTLRQCLDHDNENKMIIFEVSGTITLGSRLRIDHPYVTIAGQTAPSPGIQITGHTVVVRSHDILIQHLRIRPNDFTVGMDAIWIFDISNEGDVYNIVIDHNTMQYSSDEIFSVYSDLGSPPLSHDITGSNNIIAECIGTTVEPFHSFATLFLGTDTTFFKNLYVSNRQRIPLVKAGSQMAFVNNYVYNTEIYNVEWAGTSGTTKASIVGNIIEQGPDSAGKSAYLIHAPSGNYCQSTDEIYLSNNVAPTITGSDQWDGVYWGCSVNVEDVKVLSPPVSVSNLNILDSGDVKSHVTSNVGAWPAYRDSDETRIISEINSGGSSGSLKSGVQTLPTYVMNTHILTIPSNPHADDDSDGYTNLEEWLHAYSCEVEGRVCDTECHQADTNCNGCIDITELMAYVSQWKSGSVSISDLMEAIGEWKNGC